MPFKGIFASLCTQRQTSSAFLVMSGMVQYIFRPFLKGMAYKAAVRERFINLDNF